MSMLAFPAYEREKKPPNSHQPLVAKRLIHPRCNQEPGTLLKWLHQPQLRTQKSRWPGHRAASSCPSPRSRPTYTGGGRREKENFLNTHSRLFINSEVPNDQGSFYHDINLNCAGNSIYHIMLHEDVDTLYTPATSNLSSAAFRNNLFFFFRSQNNGNSAVILFGCSDHTFSRSSPRLFVYQVYVAKPKLRICF